MSKVIVGRAQGEDICEPQGNKKESRINCQENRYLCGESANALISQ